MSYVLVWFFDHILSRGDTFFCFIRIAINCVCWWNMFVYLFLLFVRSLVRSLFQSCVSLCVFFLLERYNENACKITQREQNCKINMIRIEDSKILWSVSSHVRAKIMDEMCELVAITGQPMVSNRMYSSYLKVLWRKTSFAHVLQDRQLCRFRLAHWSMVDGRWLMAVVELLIFHSILYSFPLSNLYIKRRVVDQVMMLTIFAYIIHTTNKLSVLFSSHLSNEYNVCVRYAFTYRKKEGG